jgi:hypothetical protein
MVERETPATYARAEPRWFGLPPLGLVTTLTVVAAVAGVLLLAGSHRLVGGLLLVLALAGVLLLAAEVRRRRDTRLQNAVADRVDHARDASRFGLAAVFGWARAAIRVALLRFEASRLLREREHADDARRSEIDARLAVCMGEVARAVDETHARVAEERLATSATVIVSPEDAQAEVGDRGFEPRTSALSERRSNQLS